MKFTRWSHTLIRIFSLFLIIFQFFGIEAIAQEIPSATSEATVTDITTDTTQSEIPVTIYSSSTEVTNNNDTPTDSSIQSTSNLPQDSTVEAANTIVNTSNQDDNNTKDQINTLYEYETSWDLNSGDTLTWANNLSGMLIQYIPDALSGDLANQINQLLDITLEQLNQQLSEAYDITSYDDVRIMIPKNIVITQADEINITTEDISESVMPLQIPQDDPDKIQNTSGKDEELLTIYTFQNSSSTGTKQNDSYEYTPINTKAFAQNDSGSSTEKFTVSWSVNWINDYINNSWRINQLITDYNNFSEDLSTGNLNFQNIEYTGTENQQMLQSFQFGIIWEDLLFSEPVRVEINLTDDQLQYPNLSIKVKHTNDKEYDIIWLSTNPDTLCDEQGNATLSDIQIVPIANKVTFYTCRASDFVLLSELQATWLQDLLSWEVLKWVLTTCENPIFWINATEFITTISGLTLTNPDDPTFSTNKLHFYQGANSKEITEDMRIYFTMSDSPFTLWFSTWIIDNYHSGASMRFAVTFTETGNLLIKQYWEIIGSPWSYQIGDSFYFLLSGSRVELYTSSGIWITSWTNELNYPVYLDAHFPILLQDKLVETRITDVKLVNNACLSWIGICGDGIVWAEEECDLWMANGSGEKCSLDCTTNLTEKTKEVVKLSEDIQITIPEDIVISRIAQDTNTQVTFYDGESETESKTYKTYNPWNKSTITNEESTLQAVIPSSMIEETDLQAKDLILQETKATEWNQSQDEINSFKLENGRTITWNIDSSFEFGKIGEDLIFSKPVKVEVQVWERKPWQFRNYDVYTKHASDQ